MKLISGPFQHKKTGEDGIEPERQENQSAIETFKENTGVFVMDN